MRTTLSIRRVMLPLTLTALCTAAAFDLRIWPLGPGAAAAQEPLQPGGCSNTECQATSQCRYYRGYNCTISVGATSCTNTSC